MQTLALPPARPSTPLRDAWLDLRQRKPQPRQIDGAKILGVSEGELIRSWLGWESSPLLPDAKRLLEALPAVGTVMALTRNATAVHEKTGRYDHVSFFHGMGQVVNHDIDLRVFPRHWARIFHVRPGPGNDVRESIQVFNAEGLAVHKVFSLPETDMKAWERLTRVLATEDCLPFDPPSAPAPAAPSTPDADAFRLAWDAMADTHDFFPLLQRFGLGRLDALRLAGGERAHALDHTRFPEILRHMAAEGLPIMAFVGNRGCIQIHTGPIHKVLPYQDWINVMDPGFNLHLHLPGLAGLWWVRKPTRDGIVNSLELFDASGMEIALFFGERKPGHPEREDWRRFLSTHA